ncbi:3-oxoacyl-[acyl-carrier-protein] synthase-3 [Clostridium acetobutylicum]|uniref:3-oxoacyl-[acyl-carrier-protein] synthase III n=1 Tax=Clostridium acetobutylicum (strain ATCC 824 / DSM 792 / JCM 1419 / IAM 19013 / LMG 5710 / NBRC 13948 / NRRL B-527 / VKM B-1787 / 2291 / W) TaxID=272562 RepID=Q97KV2_CLOAB|nr:MULTISPECIES: 3-oxoacyl-ACP synthase III family protein [Clostridium]AAK78790.1 3-oxoacyl-[acyl-carrier-protein] synthase III [Clostridium acetobutylicum ATCC 824]ADZ19864.1 3-oxoacyl-(acyl-carrier-protein) synthase III [Clostridium acetobutylicum EA 2018]AEI34558.1 3-oxoacyl-[acyl-carrier-protein] synthase III [Clostridium acetobutylicum DSM 1731]AWV80508.1 ketoacyl-ACP synthase III [Clostridium acetobutylicum]MBC2392699.1 3-oxoacyl-ACP synthase III family protein [Clostridium acetobutylic
MLSNNAVIKDIAYYHPDNLVGNDYFIEHFDKQGIDIRGLLKSSGRKYRYISDDENETILTMGIKAAEKLIEKSDIDPQKINSIIFSTSTPEYISPTNAIKLHESIRAGSKSTVYDLNANCAGMLVAIDQASRAMRSNPDIKYSLIVGSDQLNRYSRFDEAITYANFGDSACAIILENTYNTDNGFIDSDSYTNSSTHDKIVLPAKGLSSTIHNKHLSVKDKLVHWTRFDNTGTFFSAKISIETLLKKNNLKKSDIKKYFLSQFAVQSIQYICAQLNEDENKFVFIGDKYGYTGTTSPLLAFAKTIENNELNKGDYVIFWTVGAGSTCECILYRY